LAKFGNRFDVWREVKKHTTGVKQKDPRRKEDREEKKEG
jgi:hypothetical protein